jgi:ribosomal protein S18 acetylase RimI-like enzyme
MGEGKMTPSFTDAAPSDLLALTKLVQAYYHHDGISFDRRVSDALEILLRDESFGKAWFIQVGATCVGYCILTWSFDAEFAGKVATLTDLYFLQKYRRKGLGKATLAFLETTCRQRGLSALRLEVERANCDAQGLYRTFGFEVHDRLLMTKWF